MDEQPTPKQNKEGVLVVKIVLLQDALTNFRQCFLARIVKIAVGEFDFAQQAVQVTADPIRWRRKFRGAAK